STKDEHCLQWSPLPISRLRHSRHFTASSVQSSILCNAAAPTAIYTLSLHDALPICTGRPAEATRGRGLLPLRAEPHVRWIRSGRSEEHTSELQSRGHLVCRLLLEKKHRVGHAAQTVELLLQRHDRLVRCVDPHEPAE